MTLIKRIIKRLPKRIPKKAIIALLVVVLTASITHKPATPVTPVIPVETDTERWFNRLIDLAYKADAAYDRIAHESGADEPESWDELLILTNEIIYQINEEGASRQLISADVGFDEFGPVMRSAVAGYYTRDGFIVLNQRYVTPSWADNDWLGVLVHELVHAQGYFVGESSTLEAQTELVATEVLAAMANLDYPGARVALLDGLRRDALAMAFYIAQFGGAPIFSTYAPVGKPSPSDAAMLARVSEARASVFTPTELARSERRIRWWMQAPVEYFGVLSRYVVKVTTMQIDAACSGSGLVREQFDRAIYYTSPGEDGREQSLWSGSEKVGPLVLDDLAWVLKRELRFC